MIDLHNHMLPGIDDGARDWEQSLEMAWMAVEDGIEGVVCTPHWGYSFYDNTRSDILRVFQLFREKLEDRKIPLKIFPGAELHYNQDIPRRIWDETALTLNDTGRYALIELPHESVPENTERLFGSLLYQKVIPVISHPERNAGLLRNPHRLSRLIEMGALTQVTAASLLGRFGSEIQKFTVFLMEHRMVHVLATDAHGNKARSPHLAAAYREAERILGKEAAHQMVSGTPLKIIRGEPVGSAEPVRIDVATYSPFWKRALSYLMPGRP
ncbi:MAG: tyrosine-protein phosphatase [Syntrophobacteraceae bacterium]